MLIGFLIVKVLLCPQCRNRSSGAKFGSLAEKDETVCMGSCKKFTKPVSKEAAEICTLLKPDLLEGMDACAKFIDGIRGVV